MTEMKYIEDDLVGEKYKPGQSFHFRIAVPCVCGEFWPSGRA